jgi:hypothetical protein
MLAGILPKIKTIFHPAGAREFCAKTIVTEMVVTDSVE